MRVVVTTAGSRGDVQPYVALGLGLKEAGHEVRLATYAPFEGLVRGRGLDFRPVSGDPTRIVAGWLEGGRNPLKGARTFRRNLGALLGRNLAEYADACRDADAVVYAPLGFHGLYIAEKMGIPAVGAAVQPLFGRTRDFPSAFLGRPPGGVFAGGPLGRLYNLAAHLAAEQVFWQTMRPVVGEARRKLGLKPLPLLGPFADADLRRRLPVLYGWSPSVLPRPPEWEDHLGVTGYWFLDRPASWEPPKALLDFLDAGPPPVSVGFGSTIEGDPEEVTATVVEALGRAGQRGILLTGWGGLGGAALPEDFFQIDQVPHDWLFPRVTAAVHHGGAGTTAASLRAGVPTVVVHSTLEESFWGWRVASSGAGPEPIPRARLAAGRLADAIRRAATDSAMGEKAGVLGKKIRAEDGVGRAVDEFHRLVARA